MSSSSNAIHIESTYVTSGLAVARTSLNVQTPISISSRLTFRLYLYLYLPLFTIINRVRNDHPSCTRHARPQLVGRDATEWNALTYASSTFLLDQICCNFSTLVQHFIAVECRNIVESDIQGGSNIEVLP